MSSISGSSGGVSSVGTVGSTPNSSGASVSGSILTLQPADGSNPGILNILSQTIAGTKTFKSLAVTADNNLAIAAGGAIQWLGASSTILGGSTIDTYNIYQNGYNAGTSPQSIRWDSSLSTYTIRGLGFITSHAVTQNNTATVSLSITSSNRVLFTNVGSTTTQVFYNLPAATVGLDCSFIVEDSGGMVIDANGTNQIRYVSTAGTGILGGAGGTITTTVQGAAIRLVCHKATIWSVQSVIGTIGAAATNWVVT